MFSEIGRAGEHTGRVFGTCWGLGGLWSTLGDLGRSLGGFWRSLADAVEASGTLLGRHLMSLEVPVGDLGTSWGDLGIL